MHKHPANIHKRAAIMAALSRQIGFSFEAVDLKKALHSAASLYARHCGNTSRHTPHQGAQECARRRRQLARGII